MSGADFYMATHNREDLQEALDIFEKAEELGVIGPQAMVEHWAKMAAGDGRYLSQTWLAVCGEPAATLSNRNGLPWRGF